MVKKQRRCSIGERRMKGKCVIKKGEKVGVRGDSSVGMSGWEGKIQKYTGKGYYLVKDTKTKDMEEIHRKHIITAFENRRM